MADVFISYSRRDGEFVQRLNNAFVGANRVVWVDWQSIPRGEDWWREIQAGIESADAFVTVISEHWLTSEICHNELLHARQNNKRVLPVIRQRVQDDIEKRVKGTWMDTDWEQTARDNWDYIRHLNWIFFDDDTKFDTEFAALLTALEEDQPHIKAHTRYQNDALEWERSGRNPSFLMSGDNLVFAEAWLAESAGKEPEPTAIQRQYIAESRRVEDELKRQAADRESRIRRSRLASVLLAILSALAIVATSLALNQAIETGHQVATATVAQGQAIVAQETSIARESQANEQVVIAEATLTEVVQDIQVGQNIIESLRMAAEASTILNEDGNAETAALLAIHALNITYSPAADSVLMQATDRLYTRRIYDNISSPAIFSPDGRYILGRAADELNTVYLLDADTGAQVDEFSDHTDSITMVDFSPNGQYVLTSSRDHTTLWDVQTGTVARRLAHERTFAEIALFSPDNRYVLIAEESDYIARLFDVETGAEVRGFTSLGSIVEDATFSPDGRCVLIAAFVGAQLWDVETGEEVQTYYATDAYSVAFSPDGRYILIGGGGIAHLLDFQTGVEIQTLIEADVASTHLAQNLAFSPDGRYALTINGDFFKTSALLWDVETGRSVRHFTGNFIGDSVVFSPDGRYILTGNRLLEADPGKQGRVFLGHTDSVASVDFSPDGRFIVSGGSRENVRLWDTETGEQIRVIDVPAEAVMFSPDGRYLLTTGDSDDPFARLWDTTNWEQTQMFPDDDFGYGYYGSLVDFSPDSHFVLTAGFNNDAILWDIETARTARGFTDGSVLITLVAFSPDGHYVLTVGKDETIARLWDVETGDEVRQFTGSSQNFGISAIAFSPDSRYVLTVGGYDTAGWQYIARLWDVQTGAEIRQFMGHRDVFFAVAFSPDGRYLLTGSFDYTARLWSVETGEQLRIFPSHNDVVSSVAFSPDGSYFITGSYDNTIRLWDTDYHDLIAYACTRVFRDFTDEERAQYGITDNEPTCPQFATSS